jgi:hypothetical protein
MNNSNSFNNALQKTNAVIQNNVDAITSERKKLMNDKLAFIKRCQSEQNNLDKTRSDFEQEKISFNSAKVVFEEEKSSFNSAKIAFEQEKNAFNSAKIAFEEERTAFEQQTPQEKNSKLRHFSITTYKK